MLTYKQSVRTQIAFCLASTAPFGLSSTKTSFGARVYEISGLVAGLNECLVKPYDEGLARQHALARAAKWLVFLYEMLAWQSVQASAK